MDRCHRPRRPARRRTAFRPDPFGAARPSRWRTLCERSDAQVFRYEECSTLGQARFLNRQLSSYWARVVASMLDGEDCRAYPQSGAGLAQGFPLTSRRAYAVQFLPFPETRKGAGGACSDRETDSPEAAPGRHSAVSRFRERRPFWPCDGPPQGRSPFMHINGYSTTARSSCVPPPSPPCGGSRLGATQAFDADDFRRDLDGPA